MKVLIISHNVISTENNMGKTLLSLFDSFSPDELCQLYIYPTIPNADKCKSYYRITDKDVLRNLLKFGRPGEVIDKSCMTEDLEFLEIEPDERFFANKNNSKPIRRILRDFMWKLSNWNNRNLRNWISKEKPSCIFLAPGYAKFIYEIALKISRLYKLPIITYICDDYYFVKSPQSIIGKVQYNLLKKKMEELLSVSSHVITICDELKYLYEKKFNVPCTTVMTGATIPIGKYFSNIDQPKSISYFGNIRCNRYLSLIDIGNCLDEINLEKGYNYKLKVYTSEREPEVLKLFDNVKSIEMKGYVTGSEFEKEFFDSDLLLHVEAFDEDSVDLVKHSVSTKIADSLASGIPMIAYGPQQIASINYLEKNEAAYVITDKLRDSLIDIFNDVELREKISKKAKETAYKYNNRVTSSNLVKSIIKEYNE